MNTKMNMNLNEDFDELLMEKRGIVYWIHFAVRPFGNRRHTNFKK